MVNSHYVPQLILRHFADDERIQYCDLNKKKVETRNIKSTFAEKGYYPNEIEEELMVASYSDNFYKNIDKVLACENADQMMDYLKINHLESLKKAVKESAFVTCIAAAHTI